MLSPKFVKRNLEPKKATPEYVLNYCFNRWRLNGKRSVGALSKSIRKHNPKSLDDWKEKYENIEIKGKKDKGLDYLSNVEYLKEYVAKRLYYIIKEIMPQERRFHADLLSQIDENDCVEYVLDVVFRRTYDGYKREVG